MCKMFFTSRSAAPKSVITCDYILATGTYLPKQGLLRLGQKWSRRKSRCKGGWEASVTYAPTSRKGVTKDSTARVTNKLWQKTGDPVPCME